MKLEWQWCILTFLFGVLLMAGITIILDPTSKDDGVSNTEVVSYDNVQVVKQIKLQKDKCELLLILDRSSKSDLISAIDLPTCNKHHVGQKVRVIVNIEDN